MSQNTLLNVLSVQENIDTNYTSSQLLSALDLALFYSIEAIMRNTNWLNIILSKVVTWYCDNTRRKISSNTNNRNEVFSKLISIMLSTDIDYKLEQLRALHLERSIWFRACRMFIDACPEYTTHLHNFKFLKLSGGSLYIARRDAAYWLSVAEEMKKSIMLKYMRHVGKQASYAKKKNPDIDLDDTVQNLTVALSQAIDKCSSDRGTLTTYINQWFMSAQARSRGEEYGIAYVIPDSYRKEFFSGKPSNIYVSIHDIMKEGSDDIIPQVKNDPVDGIEEDSTRLHILRLAKHADPKGYGRFYLGLNEILPEHVK